MHDNTGKRPEVLRAGINICPVIGCPMPHGQGPCPFESVIKKELYYNEAIMDAAKVAYKMKAKNTPAKIAEEILKLRK